MGATSMMGARPFSVTGRALRVDTAAPTKTATVLKAAASKAPMPKARATSVWKLATAVVAVTAATAMSFVCAFID